MSRLKPLHHTGPHRYQSAGRPADDIRRITNFLLLHDPPFAEYVRLDALTLWRPETERDAFLEALARCLAETPDTTSDHALNNLEYDAMLAKQRLIHNFPWIKSVHASIRFHFHQLAR
jgi:hypothetical protein